MANYSMTKSWQNNPVAARIIRLFLGVTFIYGGWNKASDPGFLDPKSSHYIGAQIAGYLDTSPISIFLQPMIEHATIFGWVIILTEFAIGIATLTGIALQLAALGGFFLSITLWLTATWTVKPYFLGSDTAYAILWLALFFLVIQNTKGRHVVPLLPNLRDRRELLRLSGIALASVDAAFLGRRFPASNPTPEAGNSIVKTADFPVGSNMPFQSSSGTSAILFRTRTGVFAYSRLCTHQGCAVSYDANRALLICPCHGAQFDPNSDGAAISGPTKIALPKIKVAIRGLEIIEI